MPKAVTKSCPDCGVTATGKREVTKIFGWRTSRVVLADGTEVDKVQPQSRCQPCKTAWNQDRYGKKEPHTLSSMMKGTAGKKKKRPMWGRRVLIAKYRKATGLTAKTDEVMWKALGY